MNILDARCYFCGSQKQADKEIQSCKLGGDRICFNINWRTQPIQRYGLVRSLSDKASGVFWAMCKMYYPNAKSAHKNILGDKFLDNAVYLEDLSEENFNMIVSKDVSERNRICYFDLTATILETKLGFGKYPVKFSEREKRYLNWYTGIKPAMPVPYYIPGSCKLCLFVPDLDSEALKFDICDRCFIHPRPASPWSNLTDIISRDLHYRRTFRAFSWLPIDEFQKNNGKDKTEPKKRLQQSAVLIDGTNYWTQEGSPIKKEVDEYDAFMNVICKFIARANKEIKDLEVNDVKIPGLSAPVKPFHSSRSNSCLDKCKCENINEKPGMRLRRKRKKRPCLFTDCGSDDSGN